MNITTKLELLETLFNIELKSSQIPDFDFGKITVKYGTTGNEPILVKRFHTNILQRIVNKIFGTSFQSVKTVEVKYIIISLTTPKNKQYNVVIDDEILSHVKNEDIISEIVQPQIFKLKRAVMNDIINNIGG